MKKIIDCIFTGLLIASGVIHAGFTTVFYETIDIDALWFMGTGLAFLFLGFLNLFRIRTTDVWLKRLCFTGNTLVLIYCVLIVLNLSEPQAYIALVELLVLYCFSLYDMKLFRKAPPVVLEK